MSKEYVLPEGFPLPTVYARLMDSAIREPVEAWGTAVTAKVNEILKNLDTVGLDHLRQAYAAGVADGYRQALIELERGS